MGMVLPAVADTLGSLHPQRAHQRGAVGRMEPGRQAAGLRQPGQYDQDLGCGQQSGNLHPARAYQRRVLNFLEPGRQVPSLGRLGQYGQGLGCGQRKKYPNVARAH